MTDLADFLFPAPARRSVGGIVGWWERRRLPYNLFVGAAGLASVAWVSVLSTLVWNEPPNHEILGPIVVFGVAANLCYTLGAVVEIALVKLFGRELLPVGPALFRMGLTFSVGLALLPGLVVTLAAIAFTMARVLGLGG